MKEMSATHNSIPQDSSWPQYGQVFQSLWAGFPQLGHVRPEIVGGCDALPDLFKLFTRAIVPITNRTITPTGISHPNSIPPQPNGCMLL